MQGAHSRVPVTSRSEVFDSGVTLLRYAPIHSTCRRHSAQDEGAYLPCLATRIVDLMDAGANKQLVLRFYEEVWAGGNVGFAAEVFADDYVRHDLRPTQAAPGAAGQGRIAEQFRAAFPDLRWRVDLVLADGDLVAARWTASGTQTGQSAGVAPTGKRAEFSGVNIFRFGDDGKVTEIWNHRLTTSG